jgi:[ribosomal protein S5]-alanine N-acetyltransferase
VRIETKRLWLRPYAQTDVDDAIGVLGDPETMSFYPRPYTASEVAAVVHNSMESYRLHGFGRFAVIESRSVWFESNVVRL